MNVTALTTVSTTVNYTWRRLARWNDASWAAVTLLSAGTDLLQHRGNDVTLQCDFRMVRFHPFANPLVWRKSQALDTSVEWSTVNVMGVLQEPFWSTGRFDITFNERPPDYSLALKIASNRPVQCILEFFFVLTAFHTLSFLYFPLLHFPLPRGNL